MTLLASPDTIRPRHADQPLALDVRGITVEHPDGTDEQGRPRTHVVLHDASLTAAPGTFTAVLGPSGSGKSTLLSSAAGLLVPSSGQVLVAGREVTGLGDDQRAAVRREHIGMVFQQPNLFASLTATEQVLLPLTLAGASRRELREATGRARELLGMVGLDGLEGRRPHQLSGGQRQRVAIARALVRTPSLLLVDEPTSALDEQASHQVLDLLVRVTRELGPATVMVTHDRELASLADRLVEVRDGRVAEGPVRAR